MNLLLQSDGTPDFCSIESEAIAQSLIVIQCWRSTGTKFLQGSFTGPPASISVWTSRSILFCS